MKCHYEVLGVPRDVNDEDLKKSYRKLALTWHPDKNLDNQEEAKEQFQLVQQAYEVLSDSHERAWYDKHREAILKGGLGNDYKDDSLDVFPYFTTSCFKGYSDDEKGFYAVYREVFNKIGAEDTEFMSNEDSDFEVPGFGDSKSTYEDVVHPFYAYWQSYSTKKSYAWLDPFDIRNTPNRRVLRMVEKENKKVRDKARRERNEEVRNLVAFVRKRDKRVQAYAKLLEERSAENTKKAEERRKQQLKERQEALKDYKESEWAKFSNIEHELKVIEANLAAEFGESDDLSATESGSENDEMYEAAAISLYCVACNKVFKTEKAFANHENSKKHKENVDLLKDQVNEEEEELKSKESEQELHSETEHLTEDLNVSDSGDEVEIVQPKSKKKNKQKKASKIVNVPYDSVDSDSHIDLLGCQSKKQRKKQRQTKRPQQNGVNSVEDNIESESVGNLNSKDTNVPETLHGDSSSADDESDSVSKKAKGKKGHKQRTSQIITEGTITENKLPRTEIEEGKSKVKKVKESRKKGKKDEERIAESAKDMHLCCVTCHSEFPSKNKLFDHLKKTGHSVYLPKASTNVDRTDEKIKGKSRKIK